MAFGILKLVVPYAISKMHKVKDMDELNRLIAMPTSKLPAAAKGSFPKGEALKKLRIQAKSDREYNNGRSKERKATIGAAAYGRKPKAEADPSGD